MFGTGTNYAEFSWYLRLPGANPDDPWGGIVRLESPTGLGLSSAQRLADLTAATLPGFCSKPHREPRAPQDLVPIAALENHIKHLIGDQSLIQRLLRRACTDWHPN